MKYTITYRDNENIKWYGTDKVVKSSDTDVVETDDLETCKSILKDFVNPADYELTEENIKKEFGPNISNRAISQITNYYGFRKQIYGDFLHDLSKNVCGIFRYEFPEEVNHYEIAEDSVYEETQFEYYIELKIEK